MNEAAVTTPAEVRPAAPSREQHRVLCVDDERSVVDGLAMVLRRHYQVVPATGAPMALEVLKRDAHIAVIISDMRMPGMDGAAFLREARTLAPDATRMLLTGQADIDAAAAAVNEGQIFRFLTKPCPPPLLLAAVGAAVEQRRLVMAERVLLEQTLHGSIKVLAEMLGLANPLAFGRAMHVKQLVSELAARLELRERWQVEVAAMLSQLGAIGLQSDTVEKLYYGQPLSADEQQAVVRGRSAVAGLLANIPRIELVREMLAGCLDPQHVCKLPLSYDEKTLAQTGSELLRLATEFDALQAQGHDLPAALGLLRRSPARHRPELIQALSLAPSAAGSDDEVRAVPFSALRPGMVFVDDVKLSSGVLVVPRGYEVTMGIIDRLRGLRPGACREPVRVKLVRSDG